MYVAELLGKTERQVRQKACELGIQLSKARVCEVARQNRGQRVNEVAEYIPLPSDICRDAAEIRKGWEPWRFVAANV